MFVVDIEQDFRANLADLVPSLLSAENLVVKEIHGSKITGKELVEYFKVCCVVEGRCVEVIMIRKRNYMLKRKVGINNLFHPNFYTAINFLNICK